MKFAKHLIECQCILNIFKNKTKPVYHKIKVFSSIDNDNNIDEKYIACNNCGIIHKVFELCKSEIKWGQEEVKSLITTKEDVKFNLESQGYERLVNILETNDVDVCDWEHLEFALDNNIDCVLTLNRSESDNNVVYTVLYVDKDGKFKIKKEIAQRYL